MCRIAVIEDHPEVNDALKRFCQTLQNNVVVDQFYDRATAENAIATTKYALIVLDIELSPDRNAGIGIIKKNTGAHNSPIIIVSGLDQLVYKSIMLELDVWDYLVKPISPDGREFIDASLRVLRSQKNEADQTKNSDDFLINNETGKASFKGKSMNIPQTAKIILQKIYSRKGSMVPYEDFYELVKSGKNSDAIRQHVKTIRDAFSDIDEPDHIAVIRMKGVQWQD
jgi:DNA-binding response OmpR family regulator